MQSHWSPTTCHAAPRTLVASPLHHKNYNSAVQRPKVHTSGLGSGGGGGGGGGAALREVLSPQQRQKLDRGDDRQFYSQPRFVHHLDATFRAQLTQLYRDRVPEGARVLDLCRHVLHVMLHSGCAASSGPGWLCEMTCPLWPFMRPVPCPSTPPLPLQLLGQPPAARSQLRAGGGARHERCRAGPQPSALRVLRAGPEQRACRALGAA